MSSHPSGGGLLLRLILGIPEEKKKKEEGRRKKEEGKSPTGKEPSVKASPAINSKPWHSGSYAHVCHCKGHFFFFEGVT